jgi:hypothetical protein
MFAQAMGIIANCHTYVLSLRMLGNCPTAFRPTSALSLHYSNQRFGNAGAINVCFLFSFSFFPALTPVAKMRAAASTCIGESEVGALAIAARRFVFANLRQGAPQAPVSAFSPCTWHNLADRFQSGTRSPWRRKQGEGC